MTNVMRPTSPRPKRLDLPTIPHDWTAANLSDQREDLVSAFAVLEDERKRIEDDKKAFVDGTSKVSRSKLVDRSLSVLERDIELHQKAKAYCLDLAEICVKLVPPANELQMVEEELLEVMKSNGWTWDGNKPPATIIGAVRSHPRWTSTRTHRQRVGSLHNQCTERSRDCDVAVDRLQNELRRKREQSLAGG